MRARWTDGRPPELVVYDAVHECPYLAGQGARLPMRLPSRVLTPTEFDERLALGDRRHGAFLYRISCPSCRACEPMRIDVSDFPSRPWHRRALRRGDRELTIEIGEPTADRERLALYEKHKQGRDLVAGSGESLDLKGYEGFLVDRCVQSIELRFRRDGELVGIAVTDRGAQALSLVYCFWNPEHADVGIGTYSILKHVELARQWGMRHVYLGLFIQQNEHMRYKDRFRPNERLIGGVWRRAE